MLKQILFLFLITITLYAQDVNIVPALKQIEQGDLQTPKQTLNALKSSNPNDPAVKFLDAVLTEDGNKAVSVYQEIYQNHPNFVYADAALFRVFSYYYAVGSYNKAEGLLNKLKADYPKSPYIKAAEREIPEDGFDDAPPVEDLKPAEETKPETPKENSAEYSYTVQAGAFSNIENARKLTDQLSKDGHTAFMGTKSVGGKLFNVVYAGKFATEPEAQRFIALLENNYKIKGRVVSAK